MSTMKLIALLLVSFVATGSVIYQIRSRRPKPPVVSPAAQSVAAILPSEPPAEVAQAAGQPGSIAPPINPDETRPDIPASGWGRNPFLTREEIDAANRPAPTSVVERPVDVPTSTEPAAPPTYTVTAIIYGPNGSFAVVNSRVVQAGDRVGYETVKEIKTRAIVLEYEGRTRELPLRRVGPELQLSVPKGD